VERVKVELGNEENSDHFILTSALEQAEITVQKHETMTLKAKNSRIFFEALAAPIRFNRKLAAALDEHDQRVVSK
jgi:uncharacterized protein (DUF1778 family)